VRRGRVELIFAIVAVGFPASGPNGSPPKDLITAPEIVGRDQCHTLKLGSFFVPPATAAGLILKVRIDNGPVLRMLLDSGAQYIVLDKGAAAKSGHSGGSELDLIGVKKQPKAARMANAGRVEIADLVFRNCGLIISESKLLDGIDGVVPLSLFAAFLVRLDIPGKTLELIPYPAVGSPEAGDTSLETRAVNDLLFVKAVLNDSREGYVLLDTGASYSAISENSARALRYPTGLASFVPLQSGAGATEGKLFSSEVRFRLGLRVVPANPVLVVGFDQLERHHQVEVAGILGYPALRESILTINSRDGLVGIDRK
jgi:hypothetical protein